MREFLRRYGNSHNILNDKEYPRPVKINHENSTENDDDSTTSNKVYVKSIQVVKKAMKQQRSTAKKIQDEIMINLELAKDRITENDTNCSFKAGRIVAVIAMQRIIDLEVSLERIQTSIRELKKMKQWIESNRVIGGECYDVCAGIRTIISQSEQATDGKPSVYSDDDLIHDLHRRLLNQILQKSI
jgi:hypothetical protein